MDIYIKKNTFFSLSVLLPKKHTVLFCRLSSHRHTHESTSTHICVHNCHGTSCTHWKKKTYNMIPTWNVTSRCWVVPDANSPQAICVEVWRQWQNIVSIMRANISKNFADLQQNNEFISKFKMQTDRFRDLAIYFLVCTCFFLQICRPTNKCAWHLGWA